MTANKQTVLQYMDGFRESNHEKVLECLTDNVVWQMPGNFDLTGKAAFDKEIENENFVGRPTIKIVRLVEEDNVVVAEGSVTSTKKYGGIIDAVFCDVFHMQDGKIRQLTTYLVMCQARGEVIT
jgi:ketosteroid isomerase-like protein